MIFILCKFDIFGNIIYGVSLDVSHFNGLCVILFMVY